MTIEYFSETEDELIRENWLGDKEEITELLPSRTWPSIRSRAQKLKLPLRSQGWWKDLTPVELTDFERGFVVALIDSEGSLIIHINRRDPQKYQSFKNFTLTPEVVVGNTIRGFLEKAHQIIGGSIKPRKQHNPKHSKSFDLRLNGLDNIYRLLKAIEPDLTVKKEQCKLMLEYCQSRMNAIREKGTWQAHYSEREIEIANEIHRLNTQIVGEET